MKENGWKNHRKKNKIPVSNVINGEDVHRGTLYTISKDSFYAKAYFLLTDRLSARTKYFPFGVLNGCP